MIDTTTPLSERMRPENLEDFVGQEHLLGTGKLLRRMMEGDELYSIILWGPPGTGKTTLAHIIAAASHSCFMPLSAVTSSLKQVREIIGQAIIDKKQDGRQTILFVDEIHRFNKAQQDAFLPHVERGDIVFIGATTENPSFEVISPLLSRTKVLVLKALTDAGLKIILRRALADADKGLGFLGVQAGDDVLEHIIAYAQGDARVALNTLEIAAGIAPAAEGGMRELTQEIVEEALQKKMLLYDKAGEEHYNIISALHKSMRNSDADASLYWLARMLEAGEDPLYIARRLVRFASEDIGNADPKALQIALEAKEAFHFIGLPEGKLALAQATVYMATAPKSNAIYTAYIRAAQAVEQTGALPVPLHIRNAPTSLMKNLGYGKGYKYAHDYEEGLVDMDCLPEELQGRKIYTPSDRGYEKIIKERMAYIAKKKQGGKKK
jgi:putative ATPase